MITVVPDQESKLLFYQDYGHHQTVNPTKTYNERKISSYDNYKIHSCISYQLPKPCKFYDERCNNTIPKRMNSVSFWA